MAGDRLNLSASGQTTDGKKAKAAFLRTQTHREGIGHRKMIGVSATFEERDSES